MAEEDGDVLRDLVQKSLCGIALLFHALFVEAVTYEPFGGTLFVQLAGQGGLELVHVPDTAVCSKETVHAATAEVAVAINKARQKGFAFQGDKLLLGCACGAGDIRKGSCGKDAAIGKGQGLDRGAGTVHGEDGSFVQDGDRGMRHGLTPEWE